MKKTATYSPENAVNAFVAATVNSCLKFIITELTDKIIIVEPILPEFIIWDYEQSQACLTLGLQKIHLRCWELTLGFSELSAEA